MNYIEGQKLMKNCKKVDENMQTVDELSSELEKSDNEIQAHCIGAAIIKELDDMMETFESMSDDGFFENLTDEEAEELLEESNKILDELETGSSDDKNLE